MTFPKSKEMKELKKAVVHRKRTCGNKMVDDGGEMRLVPCALPYGSTRMPAEEILPFPRSLYRQDVLNIGLLLSIYANLLSDRAERKRRTVRFLAGSGFPEFVIHV